MNDSSEYLKIEDTRKENKKSLHTDKHSLVTDTFS